MSACTTILMPLAKAFGRLQQATAWLAQRSMGNPDGACAATEYSGLFALVALGYLWMRMADIGRQPGWRGSAVLPGQGGYRALYFERICRRRAPVCIDHVRRGRHDEVQRRGFLENYPWTK